MTQVCADHNARRARVFIVEDHPIVRLGLSELIGTQPDLEVCGEAVRLAEAFERLEQMRPDVVLIDLALGEDDGMELVRRISQRWETMRIIVVTSFDIMLYGQAARQAGAVGYVQKHLASEQIVDAIYSVMDGRHFFD